jgi:O-antigen ligase
MVNHSAIEVDARSKKVFTIPLLMILFYIMVEYARPGFLDFLRPALLTQIVLIVLLLSNKQKVLRMFGKKYFRLYLALLLLMVLHVFIAVNNFWALAQLQVMFSYMVIGISCCVFIDTCQKMQTVMSFFVLVMALGAVNRVAGAGFIGVTGPMGDTNDFALAMNVVLPISFFLARIESGWRKWFFLLASVCFVVGNVMCASRGGFLGLAAVGMVCCFYSKQKFKTFVAVSVLALIAWNFAAPEFKKELMVIGVDSAEEDTGKDRVELWKVAWRAFKHNPILGVGQGNMPIVFGKYQKDESGESYWDRDYFGRAVHSVYFTLLPELGLAGTLIVVLMLKELREKRKRFKKLNFNMESNGLLKQLENMDTGLMVGIFGFLASGVFLSALYYPQLWNLSWLMITISQLRTNVISEISQGVPQISTIS